MSWNQGFWREHRTRENENYCSAVVCSHNTEAKWLSCRTEGPVSAAIQLCCIDGPEHCSSGAGDLPRIACSCMNLHILWGPSLDWPVMSKDLVFSIWTQEIALWVRPSNTLDSVSHSCLCWLAEASPCPTWRCSTTELQSLQHLGSAMYLLPLIRPSLCPALQHTLSGWQLQSMNQFKQLYIKIAWQGSSARIDGLKTIQLIFSKVFA